MVDSAIGDMMSRVNEALAKWQEGGPDRWVARSTIGPPRIVLGIGPTALVVGIGVDITDAGLGALAMLDKGPLEPLPSPDSAPEVA